MGITKQRLYYWEIRNYAPLPRNAVCALIVKAKSLFNLTEDACNGLAESAGVVLTAENESFYDALRGVYNGKIRDLCNAAAIDERAFRHYKYKSPPKGVLLKICAALGFNAYRTENFIRNFGYCLSESVLTDTVVAFYLRRNTVLNGARVLNEINETLYLMGITPLC